MNFTAKKIFAAIFMTGLALYWTINLPSTQKKILYPFPYREKIEEHATRCKVDTFLAVSVMKVESNFTEGALSHSGAIGLMQIMPDTAAWIAHQLNEKPPTVNELHNCDTNIKYGIWYLSELEYEFFGNDVLALAAYNAGRGNVHHWIETNGWQENFSDVDAIPYSETRKYVRRVLECREKYHELYGDEEVATNFVRPQELRFVCLGFIKEQTP